MAGKKKATQYISTEEHRESMLRYMMKRGVSDTEMCYQVGISPDTLRKWKRNNQEFVDDCMNWEKSAVSMIKRSLFDMAMGYERVEKIFNNAGEQIGTKTVHVPANFNAAKFYLCNKAPDEFKDRIELEGHMNHVPVNISFVRKNSLPGLDRVDKKPDIVIESEEKKDA